MKKEEIHWLDWHRILFGITPEYFLLEVLVRTMIIYLCLLIILRLLGKRMGGQLTISELAIMLTLGAIISVPMQIPERGLLQGFLVLLCALVFERGVNYLSVKNLKIERFVQGSESLLVKNGVMVADQLKAMKISEEQMMAVLRGQKIYNLGEVHRAYIEACGLFSVFKYPKARPGLALLPVNDAAAGTELSIVKEVMVCISCGYPAQNSREVGQSCKNCNANEWTAAVIAK